MDMNAEDESMEARKGLGDGAATNIVVADDPKRAGMSGDEDEEVERSPAPMPAPPVGSTGALGSVRVGVTDGEDALPNGIGTNVELLVSDPVESAVVESAIVIVTSGEKTGSATETDAETKIGVENRSSTDVAAAAAASPPRPAISLRVSVAVVEEDDDDEEEEDDEAEEVVVELEKGTASPEETSARLYT